MIVLKLTQAFNPGMFDEGNTYPHVLVTNFNIAVLEQLIEIRWEYGTFDPAKGWVSGKAGLPQRTVLQNEDFAKAVSAMPQNDASDSILMAVARECYTILSETSAAPGEVVDISVEEEKAPAAQSSASETDTGTSSAPAPRVKKAASK